MGHHRAALSLTGTMKSDRKGCDHDNVFVFDMEGQGFVMVSGNTVLPPILCYSFEGPMPSLDEAPDNLRSWMAHYGEMIDFAMENGIQPEPDVQRQWDEADKGNFSTKSTATVDPLITTYWNQDCYYNEYCPTTGGGWWGGGPCGHVYAGCVACAMAQVMKYWNHPEVGFGSHSYIHSEYGEQSANFGGTTYQWSQMPSQLYNSNDAVATLMYHCGVSVNMNYGPSGSGARSKDVETALRSYFGYCGAKYYEKSKFDETTWSNMLKAELDNSHPIYYSGSSGSAGHAFVCDGYDNNNLFHFNFGWSGAGDSFCSLYEINGYNQQQAAVMNIFPFIIRPDANGIIYVSADGNGDGSSWDNATSRLEFASCLSSGNNQRVWVKSGTYHGDDNDPENAFCITACNLVYGGFNGDETPDFDLSQRDLVNNATILDGGGNKRVLNQEDVLTAMTQAVWDGFTLQNGHAGAGAGAYLNGYSTLSNCVIRDNVADGFGGGVYFNTSNGNNQIHLDNCDIHDNTAPIGGGLCSRTSPVITNCFIRNNTATTKGGGIYLYLGSQSVLRGCIVSNNSAEEGGGIYARGICHADNCDIVMNSATDLYGGMYNESTSSTYTSCILWGNEAEGNPSQNEGQCHIEYCAAQGNIPGTGNINLPAVNDGEEPGVYVRFTQPAEGAGATYSNADWSIQPRSICLNSGKPGSLPFLYDIAGNPRIQHDNAEIGAYELNAALTRIDGDLSFGPYVFNGQTLNEPGYYTALFTTPTCDSVVGLTLHIDMDVDDFDTDEESVLGVDVYSILGQHLGHVGQLDTVNELNMRPGCYILRIQTTVGIKSKKIIIGQ